MLVLDVFYNILQNETIFSWKFWEIKVRQYVLGNFEKFQFQFAKKAKIGKQLRKKRIFDEKKDSNSLELM